MHCSPPDSSVHRILQARILEWVAISSSRGSSLTQGSNPHLLCWQMDSLPLATTWEVQDRSKQWKGSEDDVGEEMKSLRASKRNQDLSPRQAHFWLQLPRKGLKNGRTDSQKWKAQEKASPYGGFCSKGGIIESFHWKTSYSFEHVYCRAWVIQNLLYLETAKETLMYRTVLWTLWERERVGRFGRMALKHVKYHIWNELPVQVRCTILDAWGWCTGTTRWDGVGREVGGGFRMGNTCIPVADSFWYLAKLIQLCKV